MNNNKQLDDDALFVTFDHVTMYRESRRRKIPVHHPTASAKNGFGEIRYLTLGLVSAPVVTFWIRWIVLHIKADC